jgi:hypothetical protein
MRKQLRKKGGLKEKKALQRRVKKQAVKARVNKQSGGGKKGEALPYLSTFFSVWGPRV